MGHASKPKFHWEFHWDWFLELYDIVPYRTQLNKQQKMRHLVRANFTDNILNRNSTMITTVVSRVTQSQQKGGHNSSQK